MLSLTWTIAKTAFLESVRQPIYFIIILLSGAFQYFNVAISNFTVGYDSSAEVTADNQLLLELSVATVLGCGALLAGFCATAAISREIENKTALTVVSKPVPRFVMVLGKFLGSSLALLIAIFTMIIFLQMGIRHSVLSTVRDPIDMPVMVFGWSALVLAFGIGAWTNFFYGWHFAQVCSLLLAPFMTVALVLVFLFDKEFKLQPLLKDFKPSVTVAAAMIVPAMLVIASVAVAASTRLGQVPTILLCFGVFVLGLLSNTLVGRHAYSNTPVGQIESAKPASQRPEDQGFNINGATYQIKLKAAPRAIVQVGSSFKYGPNPNGFDLLHESFQPWKPENNDPQKTFAATTPPALVVTAIEGRNFTVRNLGGRAVGVVRPPQPEDFFFIENTRVSSGFIALWGLIPNMQFYWLTDAVNQNRPIPAAHVLMLAGYSAAQVVMFLSLAVALFQRREVG